MTKVSMRVKLAVVVLGLVSFFMASKVSAADFNVIPAADTLGLNQTLTVDVKINAASASINAAQGTLKFSPSILQVKSVSKTNSIFNFWLTEPVFSNTNGTIEFLGGTPNGVAGSALQVLRIVFTTSGVGSSDLVFTDSSITAADGTGKNIISKANGASFVVAAQGGVPAKGTPAPVPTPKGAIPTPQQISRTPAPAPGLPSAPMVAVSLYPDPNGWYNRDASFTASWPLSADIIGVNTVLNQSPRTEIPNTSQGLFESKTFPALRDDGVYYLHVKFQNSKGWGLTAHYRIAMDTQPPLPFNINLTSGGLVSDDPAPTLSFATGDSLSGIDRYAILINSEDPIYTQGGTYRLQPHAPGTYNITVRAIDLAGNSIEGKIKLEIAPIESPAITFITDHVIIPDIIRIKGSAPLGYKVVVSILDSKKFLVDQSEVLTDINGTWSFQLERTLNPGTYFITAVTKDSRGALSLPTSTQKITISETPIISLFGLDITLRGLSIFLFIVVIVTLLYFMRRITIHQFKVTTGSTIIGRDLTNALDQIKKEVEKMSERQSGGPMTGTQIYDNSMSLKKINDIIDRIGKYINKDISSLK